MTIHYGFEDFPATKATVVTVGSFDGVHAGHGALLRHLVAMAEHLSAESVVVTFDPHPRIAMQRAEGMQLLTSVEERAAILSSLGVQHLVVARFDEEFRSQSYESFVRDSLVARLGMRGMVVGYNHRFGRGNEGCFERLQPLAASCGFEVRQEAQYTDTGDKVSSTVIRNLIAEGKMQRAVEMLGHPYIIIGMAQSGVVTVDNVYKLLPPSGCYSAMVNDVRCDVRIEARTVQLDEKIDGRVVIEIVA